ncbi:hypothetical protein CQW23_08745 [Capsicum baccatum]|uniref:X8 domain-containing protein n=1 Tax=Capsicum baccatum TaxID=33114 RepID=A0A2G2X9Y3_CAPBA|nr:hypothetical protein CQW23_08745 [Capsicum baccatum]
MRLTIGIILVVLLMTSRVNSYVGITYGRQQSQQLVPSMVVDMLLQNKISAVRFMTSASDIIQIFAATNISTTIRLTNRMTNNINKKHLALAWLNEKIKVPANKGVKIVGLAVGAEPFSNTFLKDIPKFDAVASISLMREVLDEMDFRHVITTTAHGVDVFNVSKVPSETGFRDDVKGVMLKLLEFYNKTGAPFVVNMFPLHIVRDVLNCPIEFTFFDNMSNLTITDGNATYTNAVELIYDSVVSAITNAGYSTMKIVIGEIGWPTDGYSYANIKNAERFYKGLLKFIASEKGTPLRPGPIDIYLHSLSDENKFGRMYGAFQRHWGIYEADGNPKYKIDFTLQDRDEYPYKAKGIVSMPRRWCVFNGDTSNLELVKKNFNFACGITDCTPLEEGGSCGGLSEESKFSYAFNGCYQRQRQVKQACDFDGLGIITTENPSQDKCEFVVEVLALEDHLTANTEILLKV